MLVLTVIGPDRPGLVELLSRIIAGHGGNWLESRMNRLGGQFAGIIRVEIPTAAEPALAAALAGLSSQSLTVVCRSDGPEPPAASPPSTSSGSTVPASFAKFPRPSPAPAPTSRN
jgi:glycine cleavage system regulatory protein